MKGLERARTDKMGIKQEYEIILVKEEEGEIRRWRTGVKQKKKQGGEKGEFFFSSLNKPSVSSAALEERSLF